MAQGDLAHAFAAASELVAAGTAENAEAVLDTVDALFRAGAIEESVSIWNQAVRAGWLKADALDPQQGRSLANQNFSAGFGQAFYWRSLNPPQIVATSSGPDGGLGLEFSGRQPETCDIAGQFVPLLPKRSYSLTVHGRAEGIAPDGGVQWSIITAPAGKRIAGGLLGFNGSEPGDAVFSFETPADPVPTELLLSYTRTPGQVRIQGRLWIDWVHLALER